MTWLRYIPHDDVGRYQAAGWSVSSDLAHTHHGAYAVLMQWVGDGEPPEAAS